MISELIKKLKNSINFFRLSFRSRYFGFVQGHSYITNSEMREIKILIGKNDDESENIISSFEIGFSEIIGEGKSVSFAAARMAFFSLMKELKIGSGDEVILQAFNCSVMVNAIWRIGAIPVFADIDPKTFGSSEKEIEKKITSRTKMIVAQHSFGIPCKIEGIVKLAKSHNIFLLEDCALSLGSTISGISIGDWGDASLFSTDHSKPLNTFIGGLIYSKNYKLIKRLQQSRATIDNLSVRHQRKIFEQIIFERKYFNTEKLGIGSFISYCKVVLTKLKISNWSSPVLTDDYVKPNENNQANYPYPAKLPSFLAKLGLYELNRWNHEKENRVALLKAYLHVCEKSNCNQFLPLAYFDTSLQIVPLRFVLSHPESDDLRKKMASNVDVEGFWFLKPIVACERSSDLGYVDGSCVIAEKAGKEIINFPCTLDHYYDSNLLGVLKNALTSHN